MCVRSNTNLISSSVNTKRDGVLCLYLIKENPLKPRAKYNQDDSDRISFDLAANLNDVVSSNVPQGDIGNKRQLASFFSSIYIVSCRIRVTRVT